MARSINASAKSRGRPPTTGTGKTIGVRIQADMLAQLDAFIAKQPKRVSRPEAIRAFVAAGLHLVDDYR
jgi:hypothetical protein